NSDGQFVGDGVLFFLEENHLDVVANPSVVNWLQYHFETGNYDAELYRDDNSNRRVGPPRLYRYELQGPAAGAIVEALTGQPLPQVKFFHMTDFTIAGVRAQALRHGMAGQPGFEIFGPWEEGEKVLEAIEKAGEPFGL